MESDRDEGARGGDAMKGLMLAAGLAAVVALGALGWWLWARPSSAPTSPSPAPRQAEGRATPPPAAAPAPEPGPAAEPARRRERAPREKAPAAPAPEPAPAAPAGPVLIVESDIPGASVFLNRKFLGTTPLRSTEVTAGSGQLNASAEGYDGIVQAVEIAESGPTEVRLRFKDVRLDVSVAVVHKHGMGSCEGTLKATTSGLRYDTTNKGDAFTLGFADLEAFDVDYLQKNLRVKKRGGRTWNFSTRAENADPLFVFHRDVDKARKRLAGG